MLIVAAIPESQARSLDIRPNVGETYQLEQIQDLLYPRNLSEKQRSHAAWFECNLRKNNIKLSFETRSDLFFERTAHFQYPGMGWSRIVSLWYTAETAANTPGFCDLLPEPVR
jgi:hypothetical protein